MLEEAFGFDITIPIGKDDLPQAFFQPDHVDVHGG